MSTLTARCTHAKRRWGRRARTAATSLLLTGCASPFGNERQVVSVDPPPSTASVNAMGYDTAAAVGASYVQHLGYEYELLGRHWDGNVWELAYKVRRGKESRELKLKVDTLTQEIIEAEEKNAAADAGNTI